MAKDDKKLKDQVVLMALERCTSYPDRQDARKEIPVGTDAEFDLSVRIKGTLSKSEGTLTAPITKNDVLCRKVIAELAKKLEISPAKLKATLVAAGKKASTKRQWVGDDKLNLKDKYVQAINEAQREVIQNLKQKPKEGSVRVKAKVTYAKRSAVNV